MARAPRVKCRFQIAPHELVCADAQIPCWGATAEARTPGRRSAAVSLVLGGLCLWLIVRGVSRVACAVGARLCCAEGVVPPLVLSVRGCLARVGAVLCLPGFLASCAEGGVSCWLCACIALCRRALAWPSGLAFRVASRHTPLCVRCLSPAHRHQSGLHVTA